MKSRFWNMSSVKDLAVQGMNSVASYVNTYIKPVDVNESPSSTSGISRDSFDSDGADKTSESSAVTAETYLKIGEEVLNLNTKEDLENAIIQCKEMITETPEECDDRKWLVRRLIELRLKLQEIDEKDEKKETNIVFLGHHFTVQNHPTSLSKHYCDRCSGIIWNIIDTWYLCSDCEYKCHTKCLNRVCRVCVHILVTENPEFITELCPEPENGLACQNYRCAECLTHTSFRDAILAPRLCDYNGKYYCPTCHWNSTSVIPARVVQNWDFEERKVCRASKQTLKLMSKLPILKLESLNPVLFASVEELSLVKALRRRLHQMKRYLMSCKFAVEKRLLWQINDRVHFIENGDTYCLQDLIDLKTGELLSFLMNISELFSKHIKEECKVCCNQGYYCEMCGQESNEILYPFDSTVTTCDKCQSVFHTSCWIKRNKNCTKCERVKNRTSTVIEES